MSNSLLTTINFLARSLIMYIAEIMCLLHASRVQRKVRYFIHYSQRDIEVDHESDIDEFGPKNRRESF